MLFLQWQGGVGEAQATLLPFGAAGRSQSCWDADPPQVPAPGLMQQELLLPEPRTQHCTNAAFVHETSKLLLQNPSPLSSPWKQNPSEPCPAGNPPSM